MSPESLLCRHAHASAHARIDLHTLNKETTQVDKKKKTKKTQKQPNTKTNNPNPTPRRVKQENAGTPH